MYDVLTRFTAPWDFASYGLIRLAGLADFAARRDE